MDAILIAKGEDVSKPDLRFLLASRIFESTVPPKRRDNRLRDASSLQVIMHDYNITDAASYAEAVRQVNAKFYDLRSRRRKNADLSTALADRISTYEDRRNYLRYFNTWSKLTGRKRSAFEERYEFELCHLKALGGGRRADRLQGVT